MGPQPDHLFVHRAHEGRASRPAHHETQPWFGQQMHAFLGLKVGAQGGIEGFEEFAFVAAARLPADLAADMGHLGNPNAPDVQAAMEDAVKRIRSAGKTAGIMCTDPAFAQKSLSWGVNFAAVAIDVVVLAQSLRKIAASYAK